MTKRFTPDQKNGDWCSECGEHLDSHDSNYICPDLGTDDGIEEGDELTEEDDL